MLITIVMLTFNFTLFQLIELKKKGNNTSLMVLKKCPSNRYVYRLFTPFSTNFC